ncbi:SDR family NAD(P)-dependent oxidoreductase, partial [Streptomyces sp. NPDC059083]|uniref:SDR family NAD(P)-dependent oxidoreductase n=1 Tax=Streptomyces sp. NPDC059083 TaxID=3346721 RepID=UPI0036A4FA3C
MRDDGVATKRHLWSKTSRKIELIGKVVAITGGARGIGLATARAFAAAGASVAIGDVDAEQTAVALAELESIPGARVIGLPLDVTDQQSFQTFFDATQHALGPIDVLVNNAGIMPTGLFADEDPAMTARQVAINVDGVLNGSRVAAQAFAARGHGHIVNIASLVGVASFAGLATYTGTKRFVIGFSEVLNLEMREQGVDVTVVLPSVVRTELASGRRLPALWERLAVVDPKDIAAAVVAPVSRPGRVLVAVPGGLGGAMVGSSGLPPRLRSRL